MSDKITPERRSRNMARIRSKGTKPERVLGSLIHNSGLRYRLHRKDLPGKPDFVFPRYRKVIFLHGCFWHQHSLSSCLDGRPPKSNLNYWLPKLERNVARDAEARRRLAETGWESLVIWECELKNSDTILPRIAAFLGREDEGPHSRNPARSALPPLHQAN